MTSDFISELLARQGEIGPAIWTALWLYEHAGEKVAVGTIAARLALTRRQARAHLSRLAAANLILREPSKGKPSTYKFLTAAEHE